MLGLTPPTVEPWRHTSGRWQGRGNAVAATICYQYCVGLVVQGWPHFQSVEKVDEQGALGLGHEEPCEAGRVRRGVCVGGPARLAAVSRSYLLATRCCS